MNTYRIWTQTYLSDPANYRHYYYIPTPNPTSIHVYYSIRSMIEPIVFNHTFRLSCFKRNFFFSDSGRRVSSVTNRCLSIESPCPASILPPCPEKIIFTTDFTEHHEITIAYRVHLHCSGVFTGGTWGTDPPPRDDLVFKNYFASQGNMYYGRGFSSVHECFIRRWDLCLYGNVFCIYSINKLL